MANHNDWRLLQDQFSEVAKRMRAFPHVLMKWPLSIEKSESDGSLRSRTRLYSKYSKFDWGKVGTPAASPPDPQVLCEWWSEGHLVENHLMFPYWQLIREELRPLVILIEEAAHMIPPERLQIARDLTDPLIRWTVALHELVQPSPGLVGFDMKKWPHIHMAYHRSKYPPDCAGDELLTLEFTQRAFISDYMSSPLLAPYIPFGLVGILVEPADPGNPDVFYSTIHNLPLACARVCEMLAHASPVVMANVVPAEQRPGIRSNTFQKKNTCWDISFQGKDSHLTNSVGLEYIAELLRNPRKLFSAAELLAARAGMPAESFSGSSGEATDDATLRESHGRLTEIDAELAETKRNNDFATEARLSDEKQDILDYVNSATDFWDQIRLETDAGRVAKSVGAAIRRDIKRIHDQDPDLSRHLDAFIEMGVRLQYSPVPLEIWIT